MNIKMQVIRRVEVGERQVDIGRSLGFTTSSIRTTIKNADKIRASAQSTTSLPATKTCSKSNLLEMKSELSCGWMIRHSNI